LDADSTPNPDNSIPVPALVKISYSNSYSASWIGLYRFIHEIDPVFKKKKIAILNYADRAKNAKPLSYFTPAPVADPVADHFWRASAILDGLKQISKAAENGHRSLVTPERVLSEYNMKI